MYWFGIALLWASIGLRTGIVVLMGLRKLFRRFPAFALYNAYLVLSGVLKAFTLSHWHLYFYIYWSTEPAEILLSILAVHESFLAIFGDFYRLRWFRWLFPGAILGALIYSALTGYWHPPKQATALGAAIISSAVAAQYIILAICLLFFLLGRLLQVRWRRYESRIVFGFAVASLAYAFAGVIRSENGTKFIFLSQYLPAVGYILAALIWLTAFLGRNYKGGDGTSQINQQLLDRLRLQLGILKRFLKQDE